MNGTLWFVRCVCKVCMEHAVKEDKKHPGLRSCEPDMYLASWCIK